MPRCAGCCLAILLLAAPLRAAEPPGKLVRETWDAAYLDGQRAGFVRTTIQEIQRDKQKVLRTTVALEMTLKRFNDTVKMQVETGTEETADGKVTAVFMRQALGKNQQLELTGKVVGDVLEVKVAGDMNLEKKVRWDDKVLGLYGEQQLFKDRKVKPGDEFTYQHYEPLINSVVKVAVAVKDFEEVKIDGAARKLLKVVAQPEKIQGVQLPATTFWLDKEMAVLRSSVDMPGLGKMLLVRTTKAAALKGVVPAKITDIGLTQLIPLNRRIANPGETTGVVYKITLPSDDDPGTSFVRDARQQVKNIKGKTFELHVKAVRQPPAKMPADAVEPGKEFLESSYFINCADAKVKELAKQAVGAETDPWKKAQRIEKWVKMNMKVQNFSEAMATADHVAKTLEGDCTEHAMLAAAMCRAAGVPSKIAVGLVYVDQDKGAVLGFHMWTEVWVRGAWVPIDATLGRGSIGAAHLKISDHSWYDTQSLKPLLPVMRVMLGKLAVEVVRVGGEE